jgi:hypothetical protein
VEPRVGDRVSLDAKKVGQPRRSGVVRAKNKGLTGTRYEIRWDDGHTSVIVPGGGVLLVEGNAKPRAKAKATTKSKAKPKARSRSKPKAKAKSKSKSKPRARSNAKPKAKAKAKTKAKAKAKKKPSRRR